jgi:flagellar hook-associated protein 1 FlgK
MSDLLQIGRSGVLAYSAALSTVGENVSNADSEGYSRRTVTLAEVSPPSGESYEYRSSSLLSGTNIQSIQRVYDQYKTSYAQFANSAAGAADAKAQWLGTAQTALDDSDIGLGVKMSSVFTSVEALSTDVGSDPNRQAVLAAIGNAAEQFNTTANALKSAATGLGTEAQSTVDQLNVNLGLLNQVNAGLHRVPDGSVGQAQLMDQRDSLLKSISAVIGIDVKLETDGRATVKVAGDSSAVLVDAASTSPAFIGLVQSSDGRLSLARSGNGAQATMSPQSGSLAGMISAANTIASRRESLDAVAQSFADTINSWNSAGIDENGNPGGALLTGTTADTVAINTADTSKIAAASSSVANGNALALKDTRNSTGPEAKWALLVSTNATSVASANAEKSAADTQRDSAWQDVDNVSGVNLDTEAAELLRFQQAYNGSARIIQVARDSLQQILNLFN